MDKMHNSKFLSLRAPAKQSQFSCHSEAIAEESRSFADGSAMAPLGDDNSKLPTNASRFTFHDSHVLYEDNHLIAVYKPTGILVQGDKTGDKCLIDIVKKYLKDKYKKPGNVYLGSFHRLDRPAQGIVLFAKTSKAAARLTNQFKKNEIKKIYYAVVHGKPRCEKQTLIQFLKKDAVKNKVKVFITQVPDSQFADLSYEIIKSNGKHSLLKINLKTGRPHQIRAQLSYIGHPIMGDIKYGAKSPLPDRSVALIMSELTFKHPITSELKTISIEIPKEFYRAFL